VDLSLDLTEVQLTARRITHNFDLFGASGDANGGKACAAPIPPDKDALSDLEDARIISATTNRSATITLTRQYRFRFMSLTLSNS
jgi:hypothetical protein